MMGIFEFFQTDTGTCPICHKVLFQKNKVVCSSCYELYLTKSLRSCQYCGRGLNEWEEETLCHQCGNGQNHYFDSGYSWICYKDGGKILVLNMKFNGAKNLGIWMGKEMGVELAQKQWIKEIDCIIPVPLYSKREKERGYNQSFLLAQGIQMTLEMVGVSCPIENNTLIRHKNTDHQIGQTRNKRMENLKGAFCVEKTSNIKGKSILLVDDVLTTGSTLLECATTAKQGGAKAVFVATATYRR